MKGKYIALGLIGLMMLLAACEKDGAEVGSGRKVEVRFSASSAGYGANDEALRSVKDIKPETVVVPLNDDIYLSASLIPDTIEELRDAVFLNDNQKIRFAAFNGSTLVAGPVTYTYSTYTGKFTPDGGTPLGVEPGTTNYRFVAYSYYGNPTADPVGTSVTWDKDLVWGYKEKQIPNTYLGRDVDITMGHKFLKVRVKIDASTIASAMKNITNVRIVGGKTGGSISLRDGELTGGTDVSQTVSGFSGTNPSQTSTDQYMFYPSPTKVAIEKLTLTIAGKDSIFENVEADFTQALAGGVNYTLVVDIRENQWARSNIYWEGDDSAGKLTFDVKEKGHQGYQGVFFKWGSLVGISPAQPASDDNSFSSNVPVYVPAATASGWAPSSYDTWNEIPYWDSSFGEVIDATKYSEFRGDICQYLNPKYRLPRIDEFFGTAVLDLYYWDATMSVANGWVKGDGTFMATIYAGGAAGDKYGRADLLSTSNGVGTVLGAAILQTMNVAFPASGYRRQDIIGPPYSASSGGLLQVGYSGLYWSSNTYFADSYFASQYLYFTVARLWYGYENPPHDGRSFGYPIRCIKKLPTE
jgi:hypothetical protein